MSFPFASHKLPQRTPLPCSNYAIVSLCTLRRFVSFVSVRRLSARNSPKGAFVVFRSFVCAHASRIVISADRRRRCVRINHLSTTI